MKTVRSLLHNTGMQTVLVVVLALALFQVWLYAQAPAKIDPRVTTTIAENGRANILVELNFPPERYHIQALQNFGRIGGADGNEVTLRNVNQDGIESLARTYWVKSIRLLENQ